MTRPNTITIPLTDEQLVALANHFLWLEEANEASGKFGAVLAQVYPDGMRVSVLDHERVSRIFTALGQDVPGIGVRTAAAADDLRAAQEVRPS